MSLFGSKSSSSTSVETTNIGFSEVAGPAIVGSNNAITDLGAIQGALDFAREQSADQVDLSRETIDANVELFKVQADLLKSTGAAQTQLTAGFGTKLQEFAAQATKSEGERTSDLAKWAIAALAVIVILPPALAYMRKAA